MLACLDHAVHCGVYRDEPGPFPTMFSEKRHGSPLIRRAQAGADAARVSTAQGGKVM